MPLIVNDSTKIKAIGYDRQSLLDDSIAPDGINFDYTGNFLLIANKAIPKDSQVYMEFTVNYYTMEKEIRHIPLMVGIHKEPSFGVLNSDCCLGALYYTKNSWYVGIDSVEYIAFRIIEKYAAREMVNRYNQSVTSPMPIKNSVIGIGINMRANTINIFVDGNLFYSFSPNLFNMDEDEAGVYFAIYSSESNKTLKGTLNFGRYGTKFLPDGYSSFYQEIYGKKYSDFVIESRIIVGSNYNNTIHHDVLECNFTLDNDLAPVKDGRRDLELIPNHDSMKYYVDLNKTIENKHAFQFSPNIEDPEYAYINYPLDKYKRLYFEFYSSSATIIDNYLGIPISIGLTKDPTDLSQASFKIDLYHLRTDGYHVITTQSGFKFIEGNYTIENPIYPIQPNIIGVIFDLYNNTIELYTEGILFTKVKSNIIDFSLCDEPVYAFIESAADKFTGTGHIICNFGTKNPPSRSYTDDNFRYTNLVDEDAVLSLWYYYNYTVKTPYYNGVDRVCDIISTIKVISDKLVYGKNIYAKIIVPEIEKQWTPGLNRLWKSYNKVTKSIEPHNVPDKSIYDLHKLIEQDKEFNKR